VKASELIEAGLKTCEIPEAVIVHKEVSMELPQLKVDPQQIEQVLQNLLTNAIQAMPKGGVLLVSARPAAVAETRGHGPGGNDIESAGGFAEISVSDSGVGIPPENMEKLFQPLYTTKPKGIGLGLVVCKNLVEANGGWIDVISKPGKGTEFSIFLPVDTSGSQET